MKHRNRLQNYKNHAKEGKLDKLPNDPTERAQEIANRTGKPVHVSTEEILENIASNANIQKDSARMGEDTAIDLITAAVKNAAQSPNAIFSAVRNLCQILGVHFNFMSISIPREGDKVEDVCAFNPHFKKCRCDGCKDTVKHIKDVMSEFDEFGAAIK